MNCFALVLALISALAVPSRAFAQPKPAAPAQNSEQSAAAEYMKAINALPWLSAGQTGQLSDQATVRLTGELRFLGTEGTSRFLEINGNPARSNLYTLAPRIPKWFSVFSFDPSGYVRDDEKIDPDELLSSLKESNKRNIEERKRLNLKALTLESWYIPPHYDTLTKRLEWGTKLRDETGAITVNYATRILGRNGVLHATLVSEPDTLETDLKAFRAALNNIEFVQGARYSEFRQGDKVAEYGLAALVVGGAAAAVAKSGAGKGIIKIIGVAVFAAFAGILAWLKSLFSKKKNA